jgi:hypothetical protein
MRLPLASSCPYHIMVTHEVSKQQTLFSCHKLRECIYASQFAQSSSLNFDVGPRLP